MPASTGRVAWCPHCRKYVPAGVAREHFRVMLEARRQAARDWEEEEE